MAKQIINLGQVANDRTGDPLRTAFDKVNANFTELYQRFDKDVLGGASDVVYTAAASITGIKLVIKVEGILDGDGTFTRHSQTCEATIAAIYNSTVTPVISVYGIIYTSAAALATFTVRRGLNNVIEVLASNSQLAETLHVSVHSTEFVSYYD
jgi:hypothetical protein